MKYLINLLLLLSRKYLNANYRLVFAFNFTKFVNTLQMRRCLHFKHYMNEVFRNVNSYFWNFLLQISSTFYLRRKHWNRENFHLPVFDEFTCFRMPWTRFRYFCKMSAWRSSCVWHTFCGHDRIKTTWRHYIEIYIKLHLNIIWCRLDFGVYHWKSSGHFDFFKTAVQDKIAWICT